MLGVKACAAAVLFSMFTMWTFMLDPRKTVFNLHATQTAHLGQPCPDSSGIALDAVEQLPFYELWPNSFRIPNYHSAVDEEVAYIVAAYIKSGVRCQLGRFELSLALLSGQNNP